MLKALFLLIAGSVVLACFLTPPVFEAIIYLFDKSPWPYSRVFDRVVMVCACVILWIERRAFKLKELAPYFTGLSKWTGARHLALGLLLSLGCVAMLLPLVVRDGELYWIDRPDGFYTKRVPEVIIGAVLLSVIEEMLFRAIIFVQTARKVGVWLGAVFSSVFYAVVHFLSPVKTWQYTGFSVGVGFDYLAKVLERLIMPGTLPGVFGLFMIGMVLCFAFRKSGSIYLCIGLHSGWAMANKFIFHATGVTEGVNFPAGLGRRYFLISQQEIWLSILAVFLLLLIILRKPWAAPKAVA